MRHGLAFLRAQGVFVGHEDLASDPECRWNSDDDVQVGGTQRHGLDEQSIHPGVEDVGNRGIHDLKKRRKPPVQRAKNPGRSERLSPSRAASESGWICQAWVKEIRASS